MLWLVCVMGLVFYFCLVVVDSVTVVKFGTGDGFSKDDTPRDTHSIERYLEQARD